MTNETKGYELRVAGYGLQVGIRLTRNFRARSVAESGKGVDDQ
jgi:hypothetical protein